MASRSIDIVVAGRASGLDVFQKASAEMQRLGSTARGVDAELRQATSGFAAAAAGVRGLALEIVGVQSVAQAIFAGLHAIVDGVREMIGAMAEGQTATEDLRASLKLAGDETASTLDPLRKYAEELEKTTTVSHVAIETAMSLGASMGGFVGKQLEDVTKAAIGLSDRLHVDLTTGMEMVVKAGEGFTTTLARHGIVLDENASAQEKFNALLKIGSDSFSLAEAKTHTMAGAWERLKNELGTTAERIGDGFTDAISRSLDGLTEFVEHIQQSLAPLADFVEPIAEAVGNTLASAFTTAATAIKSTFGPVVDFLKDHAEAVKAALIGVAAAAAVFVLPAAFSALAGVLSAAVAGLGALLAALASPIAIVAALGAGIAVVIDEFDLWTPITQTLSAAWEALKEVAAELGNVIMSAFHAIKDATEPVWSGMLSGIGSVMDAVKSIVPTFDEMKTQAVAALATLEYAFTHFRDGSMAGLNDFVNQRLEQMAERTKAAAEVAAKAKSADKDKGKDTTGDSSMMNKFKAVDDKPGEAGKGAQAPHFTFKLPEAVTGGTGVKEAAEERLALLSASMNPVEKGNEIAKNGWEWLKGALPKVRGQGQGGSAGAAATPGATGPAGAKESPAGRTSAPVAGPAVAPSMQLHPPAAAARPANWARAAEGSIRDSTTTSGKEGWVDSHGQRHHYSAEHPNPAQHIIAGEAPEHDTYKDRAIKAASVPASPVAPPAPPAASPAPVAGPPLPPSLQLHAPTVAATPKPYANWARAAEDSLRNSTTTSSKEGWVDSHGERRHYSAEHPSPWKNVIAGDAPEHDTYKDRAAAPAGPTRPAMANTPAPSAKKPTPPWHPHSMLAEARESIAGGHSHSMLAEARRSIAAHHSQALNQIRQTHAPSAGAGTAASSNFRQQFTAGDFRSSSSAAGDTITSAQGEKIIALLTQVASNNSPKSGPGPKSVFGGV